MRPVRMGFAGSMALAFLGVPFALWAQQGGVPGAGQMQMPMQMPAAGGMEEQAKLPPLAEASNLLTEAFARSPISLDLLLAQAVGGSPRLAQARAQTTRVEAQARQASLYPNPMVGYQGDQIRGGAFGGGEQGAFVAQTIPLGGKLGLRRRALEAEARGNGAATQTAERSLRNEVTQAFYAALVAQEDVKLRRRLLDVARDAVQTVHQLANVGQADVPDVLATEVEQEQATVADAQAQHVYLARFHALAAMANRPDLAVAPLLGDLADVPQVPSVDEMMRQSPQLAEARVQIAAAEARLLSVRREVVPDLELKAGEQYNFEQLGAAASGRQTGPQTFASAAVTIPLWNRNQGNVAAAEAELEGARENLRRLQLNLQQRALPLLESYAAAKQKAELYRTSILPRAERAAQLYEQKYRQMAQAYPQVLVSRRTLLELQVRYNESLGSVWRSAIFLQDGVFDDSSGVAGGGLQMPLADSSSLGSLE